MLSEATPLYTIGTASDLLKVHPRTLRLYEQAGLLRPARKNNRRFYTNHDLEWIRCIRYMIHERGLNQEGLRRLLATIRCWEIRGCPAASMSKCEVHTNHVGPCWRVAPPQCNSGANCHQCAVYMRAYEHVCDREDCAALGLSVAPRLIAAQ